MTAFLRFALIAACGSLLSFHVAQLAAQPPGHGPQAAAANQGDGFSGKGTIQEIDGKRGAMSFKMTSGDNQTWLLHCTKATKVKVVGTALPEYLKTGVHVRFNASVDKKAGKLKEEKVAKLTVFQPTAGSGLGLLADPEAKDAAADADFKPYVVAGTIGSVHGKTITLTVTGCPKLQFELDDSPQIDFILTDVSKASVGDSIEGQGTKVATPQMQPQNMQGRGMMPGMRGMQGRPGMQGGMMHPPGGPAGQPAQPPGGGLESAAPMVANLTEATITKAEPLSSTLKKHPTKAAAKGHGKAEKEPEGFGAPPPAGK